ncbi:hypothetical protein [uncultured Algimonas sp.]|uniref:hypothetical protein n=1 Tax=uncultured Algimonas sp. TaxID=1547920 RepID=UPI00260989F0|nr:hypothetical protein [uncultured Algimonas sp.]
MLSKTYKFELPDDPVRWTFRVKDRLFPFERTFRLTRDGQTVHEETLGSTDIAISGANCVRVPEHDLEIEYGAVDLLRYGTVARRGQKIVWRSTDKPFREPGRFDETLEIWNAEAADPPNPSPEQRARAERQKALQPSLYVDLAFGLAFFFVAREFGLVTAALTGAGATFALFLINPFVRWDLLGGFAAFGAAMALISAGLAWGFQDDLAIKLRGTVMALIGAAAALFDALVLKGGYLGKRMAMYMEGLGPIDPRRASFALAGATLLIMAIDTPLAFILTTEQWIWYNAFLDMLIALPIILGAMYLARDRGTGS